ncbi:MAG: hypothetical protein F4103_16525, partial [Boseongicola sp. SB0673_bin_14]|nr:hypothetical protein [Boseongicola sp. SB0673_bin_14]
MRRKTGIEESTMKTASLAEHEIPPPWSSRDAGADGMSLGLGASRSPRRLHSTPPPARARSAALRRLAGRLASAGAASVALLAGAAGMAAAEVLVSNAGQGNSGYAAGGSGALGMAQGFTTGGHAAGYTLESVGIRFAERRSSKAPKVTLHAGAPTGPEVVTLSGPGKVPGGTAVFKPTTDTVLAASTSYYVVMTGGRFSLVMAAGHGEDAGSASGWRVHDRRHYCFQCAGTEFGERSFETVSSPHVITVNGTEKGGTATATAPADTPTAKPTASDRTARLMEDSSFTFKATTFGFKGVASEDTLASMRVVTLPDKGRLALQGRPVAAGELVTRADIDAGRFVYTPPPNAQGFQYSEFFFRVSDGSEESASSYRMTITVISVNDPPTGKPAVHGTARVGKTLTASTGDIHDPDGFRRGTVAYQWIRVDGSSEADISGATSSSYMLATADQGKRIKVRVDYTDLGDHDESLTSDATGAVKEAASGVCDTPGLGTRRSIWTGALTVEDYFDLGSYLGFGFGTPPIGALDDTEFTIDETSYTIKDAYLVVNPHGSRRLVFGTTAALTPAHRAALVLHVCDVSLDLSSATASPLANGYSYTWAVSFNWSDVTARTLRLSLPTDTSPTAADGRVTAVEDSSYTFSAGDFGFSGVRPSDRLAGITVETLPAAGSLALDGTAVTAGDTVSRADIDAGKLVFTPAADGSGEDYASFTFRVSDGTNSSLSAYTMTIDVTPVNDPATGRPSMAKVEGDGLKWRVGHRVEAKTSTITDDDGLPGWFFHDWFIVSADGTETERRDFFGSWYSLRDEDVGKRIRLRVSFVDKEGHWERLTSPTYPRAQADANDSSSFYEFTILPRTGDNTAPNAADAVVTAVKNAAYAFEASDFNFSDPDQGSDLWGVRVVTLPEA